ncbi:hypothetical protein RSAG8_10594, partial [Rhizoctonia solani AG-8 WAC10335]
RRKINPRIAVVVVGKRHHVRFFPTHGGGGRGINCPAGAVVDYVVGHILSCTFTKLISHTLANRVRFLPPKPRQSPQDITLIALQCSV